MPREAHYSSEAYQAQRSEADPYARATLPLSNRLRRLVWNACWSTLYKPSPRTFHGWRSLLLRVFGAEVGANCKFYPHSKIWAPWNLSCGPVVTVGDDAEIYNVAPVRIDDHVIISQGAYVCGATHDYDRADFPMMAYQMHIGSYAWICARACVGPGVNVGAGAVLGLAAVANRDLDPWTVYGGSPATKIKERNRFA